jgi:hypothetical protein
MHLAALQLLLLTLQKPLDCKRVHVSAVYQPEYKLSIFICHLVRHSPLRRSSDDSRRRGHALSRCGKAPSMRQDRIGG